MSAGLGFSPLALMIPATFRIRSAFDVIASSDFLAAERCDGLATRLVSAFALEVFLTGFADFFSPFSAAASGLWRLGVCVRERAR